MKGKIIWLVVSCLMALSLVLSSCGEAEEEEEVISPEEEEEVILPEEEEEEEVILPEEEEEEKVVPPTGVKWWDYHGEPQYGGTFTWRLVSDITSFDPWRASDYTGIRALYNEGLFMMDWTVDRKEFSFQSGHTPDRYWAPLLAESWEISEDYQTFVYHIRKGIYWQDKPPMNGREFTAYDLEYYWHRMTGLGSGFEPTPYVYFKGWDDFESITATDKYTVVFKLKYTVGGYETVLRSPGGIEMPREVVEQYGDLQDWRNAVGTGPFILTDYVTGSSVTYIKNPNYWGYDQRHPENKLPYVDGVKLLIIPDKSTAYAALRTGKIFMMPGVPWEQAAAFENTNPEIKQVPILGTGWGISLRVDKEPLTDIRIRKALNMAIDVKEIAETYYGGRVEGKPYAYYGPNMGEYYTPFEEWTKEVQEGHTYNPAGAKQLLAEAGYPDGFKTNIIVSSADDLDLPQIIKGYFADIGVDMEIKIVEATTLFSYVNVFKKHDQMVWGRQGAASAPPSIPLLSNSSKWMMNPCMTKDPVFDEIMDREVTYPEGHPMRVSLLKQADMYAMEHYWTVHTLPSISYILYQPWLKGYSEESVGVAGYLFARWWMDQDLKKAMGH